MFYVGNSVESIDIKMSDRVKMETVAGPIWQEMYMNICHIVYMKKHKYCILIYFDWTELNHNIGSTILTITYCPVIVSTN